MTCWSIAANVSSVENCIKMALEASSMPMNLMWVFLGDGIVMVIILAMVLHFIYLLY